MTTAHRSIARSGALLGAVLGAALLAAAGCSWSSSQPEVAAWLQFRRDPGADRAAPDDERGTLLTQLKAPVVVASALRRPGIAELETVRTQEDPAEWLARSLVVAVRDDSDVVQLKLQGQRPADLAKIVNAVVAVFLEDVVDRDHVARLAAREALEKKFTECQADLREQRDQIVALALTVEEADAVDGRWLERELDALSGELSGVRAAVRSATADVEVASLAGEPADPKLEGRKKVLGGQAAALVAEIDAVRAQIRELHHARGDLEARRTRAERSQRVADQLGLQLEATAVELTAPPRVRLIEAATAPPGAGE